MPLPQGHGIIAADPWLLVLRTGSTFGTSLLAAGFRLRPGQPRFGVPSFHLPEAAGASSCERLRFHPRAANELLVKRLHFEHQVGDTFANGFPHSIE